VERAECDGHLLESSAHRRFLEWPEHGVFEKASIRVLDVYEEFSVSTGNGCRWTERCRRHRSVGKKAGPNLTDRAMGGSKRSLLTEANRIPVGIAVAGGKRPRPQAPA
jgi:hypothetical protein